MSQTWLLLELKNLHVALEDGTEIVKGVDLAVGPERGACRDGAERLRQVHARVRPDGPPRLPRSPRATLLLDGESILEMEADERAQRGLFLAFQYPHAVPGVTVTSFLRSAINAIRKARERRRGRIRSRFRSSARSCSTQMDRLKVSRELASRYLNDGFSGGEKKRVEILQMAMLKPRIAVPRRDRLRARHRRAHDVVADRREGARRPGDGRPGDHPLPADPRLHHP